jgi:lauroyl/myristoyl acyltransferase
MQRHLDVQGEWPRPGEPGILCTFHWGAGMWGLRHAKAAGLAGHALVAPLDGAHFAGRSVLHAYARARTAEVSRALGCPTLDTSASLRPVLKALHRGEQVMAAIDVPPDQVSASEHLELLGAPARVPRGLLRIAVEQRVPVTVYVTGLNATSGRRFLTIHQLGVFAEVPELAKSVFSILDAAIRNDPPAWHFWSEAERFFGPAPVQP